MDLSKYIPFDLGKFMLYKCNAVLGLDDELKLSANIYYLSASMVANYTSAMRHTARAKILSVPTTMLRVVFHRRMRPVHRPVFNMLFERRVGNTG